MNELEIFRTRWRMWLGQKCRKDKPHWATLLNSNWMGWAESVYSKNNIDSNPVDYDRDSVKNHYKGAIELADMKDLRRLDNLYCTELIKGM